MLNYTILHDHAQGKSDKRRLTYDGPLKTGLIGYGTTGGRAFYLTVSKVCAPTPYEDGKALGLKAASVTYSQEIDQLKHEFRVRRNKIRQVDSKKALEFTKGFSDGVTEAAKIRRESNRKEIESRYGP